MAQRKKAAAKRESSSKKVRRRTAANQRAVTPTASKTLERLRKSVGRRSGVTEKKMFGGHSFLVHGNMACGLTGDDVLVVRVGPDGYEDALARKHARPMDFTGRPLKGMVYVDAPGYRTESQLKSWIERGVKFARSLPRK